MSESASDNPMGIEHSPIPGVTAVEYGQVQNALSQAQHEAHSVAYHGGGGAGDPKEPGLPQLPGMTPEIERELQLMAGREVGHVEKLIKSEKIGHIRAARRKLLEGWEANAGVYPKHVADYVTGHVGQRVVDIATFKRESPAEQEWAGSGETTKLRGAELDALEQELIETHDEIKARKAVLELHNVQWGAGTSEEQYTKGLFLSGHNRPQVETFHLHTIGQLKESYPGRERFGVLVDRGIRKWIDAGEGLLPGVVNPFSSPMKKYDFDQAFAAVAAECDGDPAVANLSWQLVRLLNVHAHLSLQNVGLSKDTVEVLSKAGKPLSDGSFLLPEYRQLAHQRGEDEPDPVRNKLRNLGLEAATDASTDAVKVMFPAVRSIDQYLHRVDPNHVCPPALTGKMLNLMTDALHMLFVKDQARSTATNRVNISFWELFRNKGVSFADLPWEHAKNGVEKFALHVPYGLQAFYGFQMYQLAMNTDFKNVPDLIRDGAALVKLNKAFNTGLGLLWAGTELGQEKYEQSRQRLITWAKMSTLGANLIAIAPSEMGNSVKLDPKNVHEEMKVPVIVDAAGVGDVGKLFDLGYKASYMGRFLSHLSEDPDTKPGVAANGKPLREAGKALLKGIIESRSVPLPSNLIGELFSEEDRQVYNASGVRYPFTV